MVRRSLLAAIVLSFSFSTFADWDDLSPEHFQLSAPPPEEFWQQEIEILLQLQNERTPLDCRAATAQSLPTFEHILAEPLELKKKVTSKIEPFLKRVLNFGGKVSRMFKKTYLRPRPFQFDTRIHPCAPPPSGSRSYPSSHALSGHLGACVLAKLLPDQEQTILLQGQRVGDLRALAGVHFPSDVKAGQSLGQSICEYLQNHSGFMKELHHLKKKLK